MVVVELKRDWTPPEGIEGDGNESIWLVYGQGVPVY